MIKDLIEKGYVFPALLPEMNDFLFTAKGREFRARVLSEDPLGERGAEYFRGLPNRNELIDVAKLDGLERYVGFFQRHDYAGISAKMQNSFYEKFGLKARAFMFVADPKDVKVIVDNLREDKKYIGGGFGGGFKTFASALDGTVPAGLSAVNNLVREEVSGRVLGYNTDAQGLVRSIEEALGKVGKTIGGRNVVIFGAGGVADPLARVLGERMIALSEEGLISIINRSYDKAVGIAYEINQIAKQKGRTQGIAEGMSENRIRAVLLDEKIRPDVIVNTTEKGADGSLVGYSAFSIANPISGVQGNNTDALEIARKLAELNAGVVVVDVTLPKSGFPKTLEIAKQGGLQNLVTGKPMVVYQGVEALYNILNGSPGFYDINKFDREQTLGLFKELTGIN